MPLPQVLMLLYTGMLLESPQKRQQFMGMMNSAGLSVEKVISGLMSKGGAVNVPNDTATTEESTEYR